MDKNKDKELKQIDYNLDGRNYYIDMNAACDFITNGFKRRTNGDGTNSKHINNDNQGNGRIEREIITNYDIESEDGGFTVNSKTVREITGPSDGTIDNIRYDLMKTLMIQLITLDQMAEVTVPDTMNTMDIPVICIDQIPLGTRIAFNSLLSSGIIKIKEKQEEQ